MISAAVKGGAKVIPHCKSRIGKVMLITDSRTIDRVEPRSISASTEKKATRPLIIQAK